VEKKYANLLPSGMMKAGTFTTYFKHQASASIKRGRYVQLCKERKTEVKEAVQRRRHESAQRNRMQERGRRGGRRPSRSQGRDLA
jgi:hypothetical protein